MYTLAYNVYIQSDDTKRTSDSCYVNLPLKLSKLTIALRTAKTQQSFGPSEYNRVKVLIYLRISSEICDSQLPITGYEFIF